MINNDIIFFSDPHPETQQIFDRILKIDDNGTSLAGEASGRTTDYSGAPHSWQSHTGTDTIFVIPSCHGLHFVIEGNPAKDPYPEPGDLTQMCGWSAG